MGTPGQCQNARYVPFWGWPSTTSILNFSSLRPHQKGTPREVEVDTQSRAGIPGPEEGPHQCASPLQPQLQLAIYHPEMGLDAMLLQVLEGEELPVLYMSRKLSPAEQRYTAIEREALAIKWAVEELIYYIAGHQFTLVTDHPPLQWMMKAKVSNALNT